MAEPLDRPANSTRGDLVLAVWFLVLACALTWVGHGVSRPAPDSCHTDTKGFWEVGDLVSGAPYMVPISNTVLSFDREHPALVADADDPVDLGLIGALN